MGLRRAFRVTLPTLEETWEPYTVNPQVEDEVEGEALPLTSADAADAAWVAEAEATPGEA